MLQFSCAGSWFFHSFILDILYWRHKLWPFLVNFVKRNHAFTSQNRHNSESVSNNADVILEWRNRSLITYYHLQLQCVQESHWSLRTYKWLYYILIAAWIAGLLCSRTTAGRQMEELMMSLLPGSKFMMSFCDKFPLVGLIQVICDCCKCQIGEKPGCFPVEFFDSHHGLSFTLPFCVLLYCTILKASLHIINLVQHC